MQRRPLILVSLLLAAFVINLDITIVNVALPTLVRELHASNSQLKWVVDPLVGKLSTGIAWSASYDLTNHGRPVSFSLIQPFAYSPERMSSRIFCIAFFVSSVTIFGPPV